MYFGRNVTKLLLSRIKNGDTIVLTGPRQTGKTTLCEYILPECTKLPFTYISFDDPDERLRFQTSAINILESIDTPLIILDEVQKIPALFDPLKYVIDKQKKSGNKNTIFILTGSSQLVLLKNIKETLAGRVALLNLHPLSLSEVLESDTPLLNRIWNNPALSKDDIAYFKTIPPPQQRSIIHKRNEHQAWGGYPPVWQKKTVEDKINWLKDYRKTYLERDISDIGQVANIDTFALTQKLLCTRTGQILSISEVSRDLSLSVNTVKRYINLLSVSFQCYLLPPFYENIGKRFIKSPKIFFPDMGLNKVILGEMSITSGSVYESWVFSELIKWKQLQPVEPELYFYRSSGGMEVDFLICGHNKILPVEVKMSDKVSYSDARHLETFMKEHKKVTDISIIIYRGRELLEVRPGIWAVPDWGLFGGV